MEAVLGKALEQGLGYVLFVWLLFYILKEQKSRDLEQKVQTEKRDAKQDARDLKSGEREQTYQSVILELTKNFEAINNISCAVKEVNGVVESIKLKVDEILKK
jgi:hypothetical protein